MRAFFLDQKNAACHKAPVLAVACGALQVYCHAADRTRSQVRAGLAENPAWGVFGGRGGPDERRTDALFLSFGRRGTGGQWHDAFTGQPKLYTPTPDDWPHRLLCLIVLLSDLRAEHLANCCCIRDLVRAGHILNYPVWLPRF